MSHSNDFKIQEVSELPGSEALITGEISLPFLVAHRAEALKNLNDAVSLPGFRAGKVPEDVLVKKVGEMKVIEESAEIALARIYADVIKESGINALGRPEVSITKMAPGVALEFKIKVAVEPKFSLPDYKAVAKKVFSEKEVEQKVEDIEITNLIEEIDKRGIRPELKEGEKLEEKIRENLLKDKQERALEGRRLKVMGELVEKTKIDPPKLLVEAELSKMLSQFREDIERMGVRWPDYLEKIDKTEEAVREEWRTQALSRLKAELIISKIAEEEKIEPKKEELEHEAGHILSHYPDADPTRVRIYAFTQLRNKAVFDFLESLK
jgi:FKBP-type peptidyl-prolyl cis-trans isomerase (trigger factor)